jgi:hypothetical protein
MIQSPRDFLSYRFNRWLLVSLALTGIISWFVAGRKTERNDSLSRGRLIHYFYLPGCHDCDEQEDILLEMVRSDPELGIRQYDVTDPEGMDTFRTMAEVAGIPALNRGFPATVLDGRMYIGITGKDAFAGESRGDELLVPLPFFGKTDLSRLSLPLLAIIMGFIDGINPCAMWVLVYLIGLVSGINDRRMIVLVVGSFVMSSGILYFLFMTAWLNVFLWAGSRKILTLAVGLLSLGGGVSAFGELAREKGAVTCKLSDMEGRKKLMGRMKDLVSRPLNLALIGGVIVLAFMVNSVEFLCSAAMPAVFTKILVHANLPPLFYYTYIGLYTFFFMLDDLIVFSLAVLAIGKTIGTRFAVISKWGGAIIMTVLGLLLLFLPGLKFPLPGS